jgi:VanZ family protein
LLPFWLSIGALSLVQAALVALPGRTARIPLAARLQGRWWALVLPLSIVVVIGGIALDSASARFLTWLALIAVPPLAAVGLGWIVHGARPPLALLVVPLFALAWAAKGELGGQSAALALSALACVTLGWLLVCVVPARWVKLGIYAMAIVDAYLVFTDLLQAPNTVLNSVAPAADLPKLQLVSFGSALMGFGDLFIAAVLGALLSRDRRLQIRAAILAAFLCCAWDLLFFFIHETPATVPVALTLLTLELWGRGDQRLSHASRG